MRFKYYFSLVVIAAVLLSLAAVSAGENVTCDADLASGDEISYAEDINEEPENSPDVTEGSPSGDESVDLSVKIEVEPQHKYYNPGSTVAWTITASVSGATAHNVTVHEVLSSNLKYMSHSLNIGEYDNKTGVWSIGDLDSSNDARLTIFTKLMSFSTFKNSVKATTDSNDTDLSNNNYTLSIKSHDPKPVHTVTSPKTGYQNKNHYRSEARSEYIVTEDEVTYENSNNESSLSKTTEPTSKVISHTLKSTLNMTDSRNESNDTAKAVSSQEYIKAPILIFLLFIIILAGYVIYGRIKD